MVVVRRAWWLFLTSFAVLAGSRVEARARIQDPDEPVRDGQWLYTRNCSGCHNDNGDGRGATILQLGLVARDFKQGGFAFGDTREQIFRTISTGIPGRSPMPSFQGILSDEEIGLVVDHVRTLMPPRKDEAISGTVMQVGARPVIARGKLPPIIEGAQETPRGLLIGTPSGLTFAYDAADVRLLGVFQGAFADRTDWHERGGGYLKPLGVPMHVVNSARSAQAPRMSLKSTWVRGANAGLAYWALDASGAVLAEIDETQRVDALSVGAGFTRVFTLRARETGLVLPLELCDSQGSKWVASPRPQDPTTKKALGPAWWVCDLGEEGQLCVLVRARDGARLAIGWESALSAGVPLKPGGSVTVEASYVRTRAWSRELGEKLVKELGQ